MITSDTFTTDIANFCLGTHPYLIFCYLIWIINNIKQDTHLTQTRTLKITTS